MSDEVVACLRVPPHSVEAEQSVLGALLLDARAIDRIAGVVSEADFYRHEHRVIFGTIEALGREQRAVDVVTVFERLEQQRRAAGVGGLPYLNQLAQSVASTRGVTSWATIVRDRATLRRLIAACDAAGARAFNPQGKSAGEVLDAAATEIVSLATTRAQREPATARELALGRLDRMDRLAAGGQDEAWPVGIPTLDRMTGGVRPGELLILAARPSVGKSSFAMHCALRLAQQQRTLLLSMEMPGTQVANRAICALGRVGMQSVRAGKLEGEEWGRFAEGADRLSALDLLVDDEGALTIGAIRAKARRAKCRVLVVDYLQLCAGAGKRGENRNNELEEITRGLKALAMSDRIAVVCLSQLNRDVERRASPRPQLADLRDSGAIEQDADGVWLMWTHQRAEDSQQRIVGLDVAKQRDGPLGTVALDFVGDTQRWGESTVRITTPERTAAKL